MSETPNTPEGETPETAPQGAPQIATKPDLLTRVRRRVDTALDRDWPALARRNITPIAVVAALVVGFGGGIVTAKSGLFAPHAAAPGEAAAPGLLSWAGFGKPRDANAKRAGVSKPAGFAVWRTRIDTSGAEPAACIELTRPLDPGKSYADYVLISPDLGHPPAVKVKDTELCLSGTGFEDRRITLLKGLPAKGGETLSANADVDFTFGEKPPMSVSPARA